MVEVEHDEIGLPSRRDPPDSLEAENARAALGRGQRRLAGGQPAPPFRPLYLRGKRGQPHRLVHVLIVSAGGPVGADAEIDPALQHPARIGKAAAEPHVAARVVGDRGAVVAEPGHVVRIEPDPVRHGKMRAEHPERAEMRGLRLT